MAYERSLAPERLSALDRNTNLGEMIGAWAGRQAEEGLAQGFNRMLVDRVRDVWEKGRKDGRSSEFVNLSDPDLDGPIQKESWQLVPAEIRDYICQKFGDGGFMFRRDMVNNTIGYRAASMGDASIGNSRFDELPDRQSQFDRQPDTDSRGPIDSNAPIYDICAQRGIRHEGRIVLKNCVLK